MVELDTHGRPSIISNKKMEIELGYDQGLGINRWRHKSADLDGIPGDEGKEAFILKIEGGTIKSSQLEISDIMHAADETQEIITVCLTCSDPAVRSRICIINNADDTVDFILQLAADWKDERQKEVYIHSPFLANFGLSGSRGNIYHFPANPFQDSKGNSIAKLHKDFPMPLGIFAEDDSEGFLIEFPTLSEEWFVWDQKRNVDLLKIKTLEELKSHNILLRPGNVLSDVMEFKFTAIENGWTGFFGKWREKLREKLNLSEYLRKDLSWYREAFYHHFCFVYGKEAYDYANDKVDIERVIKQGEEFGGYDAVLLWHQYPMLGVDERTQWDFFSEFPNGKNGIKEIAEKAHKHGVKIFLPFKPWDVDSGTAPGDTGRSMAVLVEETGIDGIFFDTMNSVPGDFREAVDRIRPGIVFCTEMHPSGKNNIELVTGSWDQYWDPEPLPKVDLLRYVLPEHAAPAAARWSVGHRKDQLIKRAVFNGTGILIWQDVFGSWLPFSKEQAEMLRKWKEIWRQNKDIYLSSSPTPLYPTKQKDLYCNYFPSDDGEKAIYTLYNDSGRTISGALLKLTDKSPCSINECWHEEISKIALDPNNHTVVGTIGEKDILIIRTIKEGAPVK